LVTAWISVPGETGSTALALVNSLHAGPSGDVDHLPTAAAVTDWLHQHSLFGGANPQLRQHEVDQISSLRAAIRELFVAYADERAPDAAALDTVNEAALATPGAPSVTWSTEGPARSWTTIRPGTFAEAVAVIAGDAIDVLCGERAETIRTCEAHGCVRVFFREHARRRWCSTTCGDRVRAARHYRQHH
jgi:predicted RNA-binding Zn ribbon-like protein